MSVTFLANIFEAFSSIDYNNRILCINIEQCTKFANNLVLENLLKFILNVRKCLVNKIFQNVLKMCAFLKFVLESRIITINKFISFKS